MLIIPAEKILDGSRVPIVTVILVITNILVFTVWQINDYQKLNRAVRFYLNSPILVKYELAAFEQHLVIHNPNALQTVERYPDNYQKEALLGLLMASEKFNLRIEDELVLNKEHEKFYDWKQARAKFESLIHRVSSYQLGFTPAKPSFLTLFTSMFLHGGWDHLIGNMVFLVIFGLALEGLLHAGLFTLVYLMGGMLAGSLHALFNWNSPIPLVGASGAIAALMGAYVTVYGFKKIQFFYWLIFYFNYIRLPAIVLLPFWIGKELYEAFSNVNSSVAYFAHIGGLLGGASIILLAKHMRWLDPVPEEKINNSAPKQDNSNKDTLLYESVLNHIAALEFEPAKIKLRRLLSNEPRNKAYLEHLLKIERLTPQADSYRQLLTTILQDSIDESDVTWLIERYEEYKQHFSLDVLDLKTLIKLYNICLKARRFQDAETIISTVKEKDKINRFTPKMLLHLANAYRINEQKQKYLEVLISIEREFPETEAGEKAKTLLNSDYDKKD